MLFLFSTIIVLTLMGGLTNSVQPVSANQTQVVPDVTIEVNTFEDGEDFAINSVCSVGSITGGPCSLRAAISEASFFDNQIVEIIVPSGTYKLTLTEPSHPENHERTFGDLDIHDAAEGKGNLIIISGQGDLKNRPIIDANQIDRILEIGSNRLVWMQNLVLKNGLVEDGDGSRGGAISLTNSVLALNTVRLTNNEARPVGHNVGLGGAIYTSDSQFYLYNCELDHNKAENRSVIYAYSSTVSKYKDPDQIKETSIHHNIATTDPQYAIHIMTSKRLNMVNSTMSDNIAGDGSKSGMNINGGTDLWIQHSTLVARGSDNIWNRYSLRLYFSVLVNLPDDEGNTGKNCLMDDGYLPSKSGNVVTDDSCSPDTLNGDVQVSHEQVGLLDLANYGGPTPTRALLSNSPARDLRMGNCQYYDFHSAKGGGSDPELEVLETDQRGMPRDDNFCDSGAYEFTPFMLHMPVIVK